ncbi:unnamed protein product [Brassica oleracea var. botrytis]
MDPNILPNLLVCSHLISKPGERRLAMACSKEENLKMIRELSEMICPSHDFKKIPDRRKQYDGRAATACLYMDQSKEYISNLKDPNAKVTYAEVGEMVNRVLNSKYTETERSIFDVSQSKVVVFWDIIGCPIPGGFGGDWKDIPRNIKTALERKGYMGELEIYVVGDHDLPPPIVKSWSSAGVNFIPSPKTANGKETSTKTMILSASGWIHDHLRENGQEPCTLLAITQDRNFRFVTDLAKKLKFHTLLAREKRDHHTLRVDFQMQLVKLVGGVWEPLLY